jgi:hypothetical protein
VVFCHCHAVQRGRGAAGAVVNAEAAHSTTDGMAGGPALESIDNNSSVGRGMDAENAVAPGRRCRCSVEVTSHPAFHLSERSWSAHTAPCKALSASAGGVAGRDARRSGRRGGRCSWRVAGRFAGAEDGDVRRRVGGMRVQILVNNGTTGALAPASDGRRRRRTAAASSRGDAMRGGDVSEGNRRWQTLWRWLSDRTGMDGERRGRAARWRASESFSAGKARPSVRLPNTRSRSRLHLQKSRCGNHTPPAASVESSCAHPSPFDAPRVAARPTGSSRNRHADVCAFFCGRLAVVRRVPAGLAHRGRARANVCLHLGWIACDHGFGAPPMAASPPALSRYRQGPLSSARLHATAVMRQFRVLHAKRGLALRERSAHASANTQRDDSRELNSPHYDFFCSACRAYRYVSIYRLAPSAVQSIH